MFYNERYQHVEKKLIGSPDYLVLKVKVNEYK